MFDSMVTGHMRRGVTGSRKGVTRLRKGTGVAVPRPHI